MNNSIFANRVIRMLRPFLKLAIKTIAVAGFLVFSNFASAADADCMDKGGKTPCTAPVLVNDYSYSQCDPNVVAYLIHDVRWCAIQGGTWDTSIPGCLNATPFSEATIVPWATQYWSGPNACSVTMTTDTGWGATINDGNGCHNGTTTYKNGIELGALRQHYFNVISKDTNGACTVQATGRIVDNRGRNIACPAGFQTRNLANGDLECFISPVCEKCMGNPIDLGSGAKRQRESDYASASPGGLRFERFYDSAGFFSIAPRLANNNDYWRHTYSSRVVAYTANAYLMAAVQRNNGAVKYFNLTGAEMHNIDGAANRLVKLVDGGNNLTGWRLTTPESDVELYDANGKLLSITTRTGFVHTLTYDGNGWLSAITDSFGRAIGLTYTGAGLLATMTDLSGRVTQYGYDAAGRLSTVTRPDTKVRTYYYENASFKWALTGIGDENNARFATYGYGATGMATSSTHAGGADAISIAWGSYNYPSIWQITGAFGESLNYSWTTVGGVRKFIQEVTPASNVSFTFDTAGNRATRTENGAGSRTNYTYDLTRNLETSRTEGLTAANGTTPQTRTITTTWNATYRLPATITEPSGVSGVSLVTEFTHDAQGNVTKRKLTAGALTREWNYTYNGFGQVLTVDGPRTDVSDITTYTYFAANDACVGCRNQVQTITNALGHVTTFNNYDADGRPLQITDANGVSTALTYNTRGWLATRATGGETTTYDYDGLGQLKVVTSPDGSWLNYQYDAAHRLVSIDDSLGNQIAYALDAKGNRVREDVYDPADQLKGTRQRVQDTANRLARELGALDQTTVYGYDALSNLTTVTDPLNRTTTNTYDILNRLTNVNDPLNGNTVYTYDAKDRLTSVKDPKNLTTTYVFNGLGDMTSQVSPDTGTTGFTFDAAGNVATRTDARNVATTYSYDAANRVTAATVTDGTVSYEYDNTTTGGAYAKGRLTKVTDPSGTTQYQYDALGRVTGKTQNVTTPTPRSFTTAYSYSNGRLSGMTTPSGKVIAYSFNSQGQIAGITLDGAPLLTGASYYPFGGLQQFSFANGQVYKREYDLDGRIKNVTLGPDTDLIPDPNLTVGYDNLDRLTTATNPAKPALGYTYDGVGNRLTQTTGAATTTYTYPGTSHKLSGLSGAQTKSFGYDAAGNMITVGSLAFTYDGRGRAKQSGTASNLINGLGQRVAKTTSGNPIYFAYDEAGKLIGEYDASGTIIQETVWLGDQPVVTVKPKVGGGYDTFSIWSDNLNTPRAISRPIDNQVVWRWENTEPFGNNAADENPGGQGAFAYNLRFPGQYYDAETATNYNYFRDYDPSTGRYVESDPIGMAAGVATYAYALGDPTYFFDPLGLQAFPAPGPSPLIGGAQGSSVGLCCQPKNDLSPDEQTLINGGDSLVNRGLNWNNLLPNWLKSDNSSDAGSDPKAPGMPTPGDGYVPGKDGPKWVRNPNGSGWGWEDKKKRVWCPTGPRPDRAHGGPHWDVQIPGGGYVNVMPGGKIRGKGKL